jgi:hypothetical protein
MYPSELNRAVAQATGETVSTIHHLGFQPADPLSIVEDDLHDRPPSMIDWDIVQAVQEKHRFWSPSCCTY